MSNRTKIKIIETAINLGCDFSSIAMIAHDLGLKQQTITRHVKSLELEGVISMDKTCPTHNCILVTVHKTKAFMLGYLSLEEL